MLEPMRYGVPSVLILFWSKHVYTTLGTWCNNLKHVFTALGPTTSFGYFSLSGAFVYWVGGLGFEPLLFKPTATPPRSEPNQATEPHLVKPLPFFPGIEPGLVDQVVKLVVWIWV